MSFRDQFSEKMEEIKDRISNISNICESERFDDVDGSERLPGRGQIRHADTERASMTHKIANSLDLDAEGEELAMEFEDGDVNRRSSKK